MKHPSLLRRIAFVLGLALAVPALADRPSLIDLQAALDDHLSPAPAAASGTIRFVGSGFDFTFPLVDLRLSAQVPIACTPTCAPAGTTGFAPVRATLVDTFEVALLTAEFLGGATIQDVYVSIPSEPALLQLSSAFLDSIAADAVAGRTVVEIPYLVAELEVQGLDSMWNTGNSTGGGCSVPASEAHIDLAGNDPSNLQAGEIEASSALGFSPQPSPHPTLTFSRTPPNPCYLRGSGSAQTFPVTFERLWESSDAFPGTRQVAQEVDLTSAFVDHWTFFVESGELREEITLFPAGTLWVREFDPGNGQLLNEEKANF
ncbi:MAG: hypothetical protein ACQGVC_18800 [Myxococcota bacterium]